MTCSLMRRSVRSLGRRRPLARTLETCRLVGPKRIQFSPSRVIQNGYGNAKTTAWCKFRDKFKYARLKNRRPLQSQRQPGPKKRDRPLQIQRRRQKRKSRRDAGATKSTAGAKASGVMDAAVDLNLDLMAAPSALRWTKGLLRPCRGGDRKCWSLLVGPAHRSCRWRRR